MRIDVTAKDRLGITQDILAIFRRHDCNLFATEMIPSHLYIHFDPKSLTLEQIRQELLTIDGVFDVVKIEFLPTERRQNQLKVLLSRLPDPIFDINREGTILVASKAAAEICGVATEQLEGQSINRYIAEPLDQLLNNTLGSMEINILKQPFHADITQVTKKDKIAGCILVLRSPSRLGQQLSALQHASTDIKDIVGRSASLLALLDRAKRFGKLDLPVLITGETGTGKELLARTLHRQGSDPSAPFLAINCATLPENLLESELFGYAPGAFSGAQRSGKPGLFELAAGGTVFLDEIGEMSLYLQAKLLRFLQEYTFRRVGGTKEIKVKVRVVSATHRDLEAMAHQGLFREDLYYRLNVLSLEIPALRARSEDIPLLVAHFIAKAATQINIPVPTVSEQAMSKLQQFSWPGNIRQLENLLFRTMALLDGNEIQQEHIQLPHEQPQQSATPQFNDDFTQISDWDNAQQQFEKALLKQLYPQYPSTRKLAKRLGVSHNKIAMKLKQYAIG